ncbi:hypothetical protein [Romboutsia ilealis]|uniref:hypothetical protein n=1 Tax=Romboutsia ilealis TaxID=1115758 RepID=UPI002729C6FD|nr:hypothetical protein [Romboutsia ilealis]
MGIIRQITCIHSEAIFHEEEEKMVYIPSKRKADIRKVRVFYCPDCGISFQASSAPSNDKKEKVEKIIKKLGDMR